MKKITAIALDTIVQNGMLNAWMYETSMAYLIRVLSICWRVECLALRLVLRVNNLEKTMNEIYSHKC